MNYTLGIDIGSATVKIAVLDEDNNLLFSDYQRHYAEIQETCGRLIEEAYEKRFQRQIINKQLDNIFTARMKVSVEEAVVNVMQ